MAAHPLDNPFWSSLDSLHAMHALRSGEVACYPADIAPFIGASRVDAFEPVALSQLMAPGEARLILGVFPDIAPAGWEIERFPDLLQMVCESPLPAIDGPEVVALDANQPQDVLALTALVYPHYFRPRTMVLGDYFGLRPRQWLEAMAGERLGMPGWREMSAICTHPEAIGRGHARRLTTFLTNRTHARGDVPFLHVSPDNARAVELYRRLGYRLRRTLPFAALRRQQAT